MASSHLFLISTGTTTLSDILLISISLISLCFFIPSNVAATITANTTESDLLALLSFKSLIWSDPSGALSSWNSSLHYCRWSGISCGRRHPDRVTGLTLDSFQLVGQISPSLGNLTFLQRLNLSDNRLSGNIPEELGRLSRLQLLGLSYNSLQGSIPSALGNNCTNLQFLSLNNNNLGGTLPSTLGQCRNLRVLSLTNNNLIGTIPPTLGNLTNLLSLYLYSNSFMGSIPDSLGQLKSLQYFRLSDNQISGTVPRSLYNLSDLVHFSLGMNYLEGFLPPDICDAFQTLEVLSIYQNQFKGQIPSSLSNCTTLSRIDVDSNNFTGTIPSSLGSLQQLSFLQVGRNQLEAKTSSDWSFIHALINCTNLQYLLLAYNQLQGVIPSSLANITSLHTLVLSGNPISGSIPAELEMLTNLIDLEFNETLLSGKIPMEIGNLRNLQDLLVANSMISGEIPSTFGNLSQMVQLVLKNNAIEGRIPPSLGNMKSLEILDISNNKLIGEIPREIMNIDSLSIALSLSQNHLNGSIPSEISELHNIVQIDLSWNNLSGQIPSTIDGCQLLQFLYLEGNSLHGPIPSSLSNLKGLQDLYISNNSFSGKIPSFISAMKLERLDISFNDFQGELLQEGVFKNVTAVDVRGNPKLCGGLPDYHLPKCISDSPAQKHHSEYSKTILVCICGGFLCISIIICFVAGCYWRRRSHKDPLGTMAMTEYKKVSYNDLLRATNSFSMENLIGSGSFGKVYKASLSLGNAMTVAVKVLNLEQHGAIRSFLSECEALRNVRHRNLIKILSVCSSIDHRGNDFKALIFEFMPNGSLETWLHPTARGDRPPKFLTLLQRMNVAIDIAKALDYLHDHKPVPIIHCDLKPSNVLLDDDMTAHVGDFGLARFLVRSDHTMYSQSITSTGGIKGSIGYIPPEYGMSGQASTQGDVYSYGILLLEMFTGISPTDERFGDGLSLHKHVEIAFPDGVMDIIDAKLFLSDQGNQNTLVPENSEECLVSVIRCGLLCSKESSKERIAMNDVVKELNSACNKLLK